MPKPVIDEYCSGEKSSPDCRSVSGSEIGTSSGSDPPRISRRGHVRRARSSLTSTCGEPSRKSGSPTQSHGVIVTSSATSVPSGSRRTRFPVSTSAFFPAPRTAFGSVSVCGGGAVRSLRNIVAEERSAVRASRLTTAASARTTSRPCTAMTPPSRRRIPVVRSRLPRAARRTPAGPRLAMTCPSNSSLRACQSYRMRSASSSTSASACCCARALVPCARAATLDAESTAAAMAARLLIVGQAALQGRGNFSCAA